MHQSAVLGGQYGSRADVDQHVVGEVHGSLCVCVVGGGRSPLVLLAEEIAAFK